MTGAAANTTEELGWGDEDEEDEAVTPVTAAKGLPASQSVTTLTPAKETAAETTPRRSGEDSKSSAGSDTSYDIVSGATSKTPSSPKVETKKTEDSDEEDWE